MVFNFWLFCNWEEWTAAFGGRQHSSSPSSSWFPCVSLPKEWRSLSSLPASSPLSTSQVLVRQDCAWQMLPCSAAFTWLAFLFLVVLCPIWRAVTVCFHIARTFRAGLNAKHCIIRLTSSDSEMTGKKSWNTRQLVKFLSVTESQAFKEFLFCKELYFSFCAWSVIVHFLHRSSAWDQSGNCNT